MALHKATHTREASSHTPVLHSRLHDLFSNGYCIGGPQVEVSNTELSSHPSFRELSASLTSSSSTESIPTSPEFDPLLFVERIGDITTGMPGADDIVRRSSISSERLANMLS